MVLMKARHRTSKACPIMKKKVPKKFDYTNYYMRSVRLICPHLLTPYWLIHFVSKC